MTLMKGLLLGSAATLVVVAGAQAADLPTKKGAPAAEYVKVCKVGDIAGFIIPGSDTCLKISGYVNAQIAMGNVKDERQVQEIGFLTSGEVTSSASKYVNSIGFSTRGQVNFDAVTNTAMGPLLAHIEIQSNSGVGFDPLGNGAVLNAGYVQWAGITAGKHGSFYDYLAGGDTWKDFFSPDHSGTPINLLAYTATFGGGFSATLSLEQNESATGVNFGYAYTTSSGTSSFHYAGTYHASGTQLGVRAPDIVAALDVTQSWGGAHLAGVAHNVRVEYAGSFTTTSDLDTWGYGVIGGVTFNLPMLSAGSKIAFQGAYAHGAIDYSGAGSPAWGEQDQGFNTNGNGTLFPNGRRDLHRRRHMVAVERLVGRGSVDLEGLAAIRDRPRDRLRQRRLRQQCEQLLGWFAVAEGDSLVVRRGVRLVAGQEPRFRPRRGLRVVAPVDAIGLGRLLGTARSTTTRTASTPACTSSARSDRTQKSAANIDPGAKAPGFFVARRRAVTPRDSRA